MLHLNKGPSESFRKHIRQTVHKSNTITNKKKKLIQIKLMTPKLNALLKTYKEGKPNRPVINNIQAKSHKLAKYLNKKINQLIQLPYT